MNEVDRAVFELKMKARNILKMERETAEKLREIERDAKRVGMRIDRELGELVPMEEHTTIIKAIKAAQNG